MGFIFNAVKKIIKTIIKLSLFLALIATVIVLIPNLPPYTKFTSIEVSPIQPRVGPLAINSALNNAERLYSGKLLGPEAFQVFKGELYTSLATGEIVKLSPEGHVTFVTTVGQPCRSAYELTSVNIQGCDDHIPCYVTVGEDVLVNLEFYADFVSQNLDQNVVIHINHLNLRTQVSPERCGIYDCPGMTTDAMTSLTSVMSVPNSIALNQRGYLMWRIVNEQGKQVLCYRVTVQTQSRLQRLLREYENTAPIARDDQP